MELWKQELRLAESNVNAQRERERREATAKLVYNGHSFNAKRAELRFINRGGPMERPRVVNARSMKVFLRPDTLIPTNSEITIVIVQQSWTDGSFDVVYVDQLLKERSVTITYNAALTEVRAGSDK